MVQKSFLLRVSLLLTMRYLVGTHICLEWQ